MLITWSKTWGMAFNVKKCSIISITNATKNKIHHQYIIDGEVVRPTDSTVYLGVTFNSKLQWNQHIDNISGAANRMLGFLWRTMHKCPQQLKEKAYKTMIRPKLEYCDSVWDPHQRKYTDKLEMVERRAARFVKNMPYRRDDPVSVTSLIQDLGWEPLHTRRLNHRLIMLYRISEDMVLLPTPYHPVSRPQMPTRGHHRQYQLYQPDVDAFKFAFLPRTVVNWNALPSTVVEAESLDVFKQRLWASA